MYTVKTPALAKVIEAAFATVDGLKTGAILRGDAMAISSNLGRVNAAVNSDVKARLAAPRIAAYETKSIENQQPEEP